MPDPNQDVAGPLLWMKPGPEPPSTNPAIAAPDGVFSTAGTFGVAHDGSTRYTVPIEVPPSRGGLVPELRIDYSSQRGRGIAGRGFSLTGIGRVHRCTKTFRDDGHRSAFRLEVARIAFV